ncbi:MAG: homoserine dehydrogenase [Emcibacteraceae bacterium]|nr:homoserine dehydrogenase [Emcibacteraceae bacterium]
MLSNPLRVAVAGLGNVGVGVVKILEKHKELIADRAGREIVITTVCARNKNVDRGIDLSSYEWVDDATQLADMDNVDIVIELIGGEDGVALMSAKNTLNNSKSFVTANKAMIAHHGCELADMAQKNDVALRFEAAVAGGIPIIKAIGEGLAANELNLVYGIMNGTTNYMLSQMEARGLSYTDILAETEELGYLEADPALDLDGIDAAHKLAILSSVAFGTKTDFDNIHIEGIRNIETVDIEYAKELGYRIKLLGITKYEDGNLSQRVHPVMIDRNLPIAGVMDGFNAIVVDGDFIDRTFYQGRGAGEGPTASAVVADIIDIARGHKGPAFFKPTEKLVAANPVSINQRLGEYYIRLHVQDEAGVIADITASLTLANVSVKTMLQKGNERDGTVYVIMLTHDIRETAMKDALNRINELPSVIETPLSIRIEKL